MNRSKLNEVMGDDRSCHNCGCSMHLAESYDQAGIYYACSTCGTRANVPFQVVTDDDGWNVPSEEASAW